MVQKGVPFSPALTPQAQDYTTPAACSYDCPESIRDHALCDRIAKVEQKGGSP